MTLDAVAAPPTAPVTAPPSAPARSDVEIRPLTEAGIPDWLRAMSAGFLNTPSVTEAEIEGRSTGIDLDRALGAYDNGRCVATYRTFDQELSLPGGGVLGSSAVTNVSVTATHRRRGLLSRLMTADLAAAKERGYALSTLIAAEYPIYGRFGFGPATRSAVWSVDLARTGLDGKAAGPRDGGRVDLVPLDEIRRIGPGLHARFFAAQPGATSRDDRWWDLETGLITIPSRQWKEPFWAAYHSADGELEGLIAYSSDQKWDDSKQPGGTVTVQQLFTVSPAAERALWEYVCSLDWATRVRTGERAPDSILPDLLPDPRAARIQVETDYLWVRILDVVRALEARSYEGEGALVLEVRDGLGLAGGRFLLEAGPQGGRCVPTDAPAELSLDVRELGACYLGDASPLRLAALGTVREERPGAAATADRLFRTARRPWCPDIF
ncbi:GNAT family N-acetyltransferase [Streptomyces qinzhouensis]|uniref:GNAT family N-acetyltransferase n=1 Tax=Streptomyces qinzhouensis TaxID=2599401 RepID=A0A5B8IG89_9ACTN|nr:GNAT family N-acetyltransferase [Streptomyces qinzhouensis]QDY77588.1 GNAT family N-acetyltransferase [Streptomyces qinzhouensis]